MLVLLSSPSQDPPRVFLNPKGSDELSLMPRVKETMVCLSENKCPGRAEFFLSHISHFLSLCASEKMETWLSSIVLYITHLYIVLGCPDFLFLSKKEITFFDIL